MKAVDRANYVKDGVDAYFDSPLLRIRTSGYEIEPCLTIFKNRPIGHGATISAPHMVSFFGVPQRPTNHNRIMILE
jgi:hypothetical protein